MKNPERSFSVFRVCTAGLLARGSCWRVLFGALVFVWVAPLLTPWQENPQILQPARAQAAWLYAWLALFAWLPFQAAALGQRLQSTGVLEFQRARGVRPWSLWLQIGASIGVWMFVVALVASIICISLCLPKHPDEAWLWVGLVLQYAVLYTTVGGPLLLLGVAIGTRAGEVFAFLVPSFLLFLGLFGASWVEPVLAGSSSFLHRGMWLLLPHYHLADLTPRLVFKMGPLAGADFAGSLTCLALQGATLCLSGLCVFRTRS